jgi:UDP-4-amino-4,6-dideoxy-N-acetyl-beta-L-altrosamine N-acetyltransferase
MTLKNPCLRLRGLTLYNFHSLKPREAGLVLGWRNSPGVRKWMYSAVKITPEDHAAFRRRLKSDRENGYWLVKGPGRGWAGVIYLNRIDRAAKRAWLGIYANPESGVPGKGAALMEALEWLAFVRLGLDKLALEVFATNLKAIAFYLRRGFRAKRLLKERVKRGAGRVDVKVMELERGHGGKNGI